MKKIFSIILVSLVCTLSAFADGPHRLRIKVLPEGAITYTVRYEGEVNDRGWSVDRFKSDTLAVYEGVAEPGQKIYISIYSSTGYAFKQWLENGLPLSHGSVNYYKGVDFTMPDKDVELVGMFEFNPDAPTYQPGAGSWDPETGTLICDNGLFNSSNPPAGFTYNEDNEKVLTYIVGGTSGGYNNQISLYNSEFPNVVTLDLSRTTIERMYISGEREALKEVILPSTFLEFAKEAMKGVKLNTLICFAVTPPKLYGAGKYNYETGKYEDWQQQVFFDCPDMVVRVPRESVPLYQAADGWKDFTILPVDGKYVNLTIKLMNQPKEETLSQYKNMTMLLTNLGTGQVRRLLMNGRNEYEYRYLPQNSNYSLSLQNERGYEAAHVDNIFVSDQDVQMTLPELKTPRVVTVSYTADGKPITAADHATTWYNVAHEYVTRGDALDGVFDGQQMLCVTTLDARLAKSYLEPDTLQVTIGAPYDIILPLKPIQTVNATFTVVDSLARQGIEKAVVQVAQMLPDGQTGAISTLTTAANGVVCGEVLAAPSIITVTSPIHGSKTLYVNLNDTSEVRVSFAPANGTSIQLAHTFKPSVREGQTALIQSAYTEGRSLEYTFTATLPDGRDSIITHYLTSYPLYTFYTKLPVGTKIRVNASSPTGNVEPVEAEATVGDDNTVAATLPIVERGKIEVSYVQAESKKSALLVIDAETGLVVHRQFFNSNEKSATVTGLPDGNYLVAAMSQGAQYSSITSLQQLQQYTENADYALEEVTVADGVISSVMFGRVPLCTKELESNLSERRARFGNAVITIGYYAGLSVNVKFKDLEERTWGNRNVVDKNKYPTNCKLEVYLPEGFTNPYATRSQRLYSASEGYSIYTSYTKTLDQTEKESGAYVFVLMNSQLTMTTATTQWDETERKLTIDWPYIDQGGKVQLSTTPTLAGDFRPEMYLSYTLEGKQYREMIDTESITVTRSGIKVPELVVSPTIVVSGEAMYIDETENSDTQDEQQAKAQAPRRVTSMKGSAYIEPPVFYEVTIMDGDQPIGRAKINSEGKWKTTCQLATATALSKHNIYAKIAYQNGISYQTEAKTVTYDPNAVVPLSIRMSFFNHHPVHLINQEVIFDIANHEARPRSYGYSNQEGDNTDFTFEINLSNNDTTKVYACDLYIQTQGPEAEEFIIPAHYNARKNRWIAYRKFNIKSLPYDVNAIPYYHHDAEGTAEEFHGMLDEYNWLKANASKDALEAQIEALLKRIDQAVAHNNEGELPDMNELVSLLNQYAELLGLDPIPTDVSDAPKSVDDSTLEKQIEDVLAEMQGLIELYGSDIYSLATVEGGAEISHATGLTRGSLIEDGYEPIRLDDGSEVFTKALEDGSWYYVDLKSDFVMKVPASMVANVRAMGAVTGGDIADLMATFLEQLDNFKGKLDILANLCAQFSDALDLFLFDTEGLIRNAQEQIRFGLSKGFDGTSLTRANFIRRYAQSLTKLKGTHWLVSKVKAGIDRFKYSNAVGSLASLWSLVSDAFSFYKDITRLNSIRNALPNPCPDDQAKRDQLFNDITSSIRYGLVYQTAVIANDVIALGVAVASIAGAIPTAGASSLGIVESLVQMGLSILAKKIYDDKMADNLSYYAYEKSTLRCHKSKKDDDKKNCKRDCGDGGTGGSEGTIDPSGYVYEGIPGNRLEGVTATVFYRSVTKNQWGDDVEKSVMWNAEDYGQINPQLTDENGEYGWMVPAGMWQVKYEKTGYQTEYSEWLPVPPPQLDVNQPMIQYGEPQVNSVKAMPKAVHVGFDKFMLADSLNTATIFVSQGGKQVEGSVEKQLSDTLSAQIVNRASFVPTTPLPAGKTLTLTVRRNVTSYAGVQMSQDFTQDFDIVASTERLVSDSALHVVYDHSLPLTVQALPAAVSAGKKVKVKVLSDMIATADADELTLDNEGKATVNITGEAHGTTAVVLAMQDDSEVQTVTVVNVKDETGFICPAPEPNYMDGSALEEGTLISLTCELPEATIFYTTDGSCPCNSPTTQRYTEPIVLNGKMTLKTYAAAPGYVDSDIAEYVFYLTDVITISDNQPVPMKGTYTLSGMKVRQGTPLRKGIYIFGSRKIVVR